jgi:hypothetical protein
MTDYKELAIKAAVGGGIAGLVTHYTPVIAANPSSVFDARLVGRHSISLLTGVAVAGGIALGQLVTDAAISDEKQDSANETLSGYLVPAMAAGATCASSWFLFRGNVQGSTYLKLAAIGGGSSMLSDHIYDQYLDDLLE